MSGLPWFVAQTKGARKLALVPRQLDRLYECRRRFAAESGDRRGPGPRAGAIGTIQSVYICDPDHNLVEIQRRLGHRKPDTILSPPGFRGDGFGWFPTFN